MPKELFIGMFPAILDGERTDNLCPICIMTLRNLYHGLHPLTEPQGEYASSVVEQAYEYYRPKGENIYSHWFKRYGFEVEKDN